MTSTSLRVAVLLATYNGMEFIRPQLQSLTDNRTPFTLHWLDDHSTDGTRDAVRLAAQDAGIPLQEWHQPQHLGAANAFFELLERVEADVYLFCDQDDLWQPGKIDATVSALASSADRPLLCFSDPLMFRTETPDIIERASTTISDARHPEALFEAKAFMSFASCGNTQGLNKPLRAIYLRHKEIARAHAFMHDWWLYLLALACDGVALLHDAPTTLYRRHDNNFTEFIVSATGIRVDRMWRVQRTLRPGLARQARGFVLAAPTLPPHPALERLTQIAQLVSVLDRRQPPSTLLKLTRRGALWPSFASAACFSVLCMTSHAVAETPAENTGAVSTVSS